jgi:hypothetical protein
MNQLMWAREIRLRELIAAGMEREQSASQRISRLEESLHVRNLVIFALALTVILLVLAQFRG